MKKLLFPLIILSVCAVLCAFAFPSASITADVSKDHVYRYITAEQLLKECSDNRQAAKDRYDGQYLLVSGRYENYEKTSFKIMDQNYGSILCENAAGINVDFSPYKFNESVIAVFGRCYFSPFSDDMKITEVVKVMPVPVVVSDNIYFTPDGKSFDMAAASERITGGLRYYVPASWADIEMNISESGLGKIDGYKYDLNRLPGGSGEPEMLFVCWFDEKRLVNPAHMSRPKDVEKAIVDNISGNSSSFSYYRRNARDIRYDYFIGKYNDPLSLNGYHAEYIFRPYSNGMVMFLYLYRDTRHMSEVMFVINSQE